jgi:hypothetical protein
MVLVIFPGNALGFAEMTRIESNLANPIIFGVTYKICVFYILHFSSVVDLRVFRRKKVIIDEKWEFSRNV